MVKDFVMDYPYDCSDREVLKCINCGEVFDDAILNNRLLQLVEKNSGTVPVQNTFCR